MLTDKIVIVTGGASGIGRAACKVFAEAGASLVVADANLSGAAETVSMIEGIGGSYRPFAVNVADEASVRAMVDFTVAEFGRIDGAFNNAGVATPDLYPLEEFPTTEWSRVVGVNLNGVFFCLKHQVAAMTKTGGGAIVITSSGNGIIGSPYAMAYVASKHGAIGAMRAASAEAARTRVRVNAVLPAAVDTPMSANAIATLPPHFLERHSVGRVAQPEDIAYAVKWLLSDEAAYINGAAIPVDGGYTAR